MEQAERERLIQDMVGCGRAWEEDTSRPDFSLSVVQRLATLTPEEYEAVWAEFQSREEEDMEAGMQVGEADDEALRRAQEFVENARAGANVLQPGWGSHLPPSRLTTETEAILGRLLNPTTTLERLCVAAMRGDAVAFAVLSDGIQQGELTL